MEFKLPKSKSLSSLNSEDFPSSSLHKIRSCYNEELVHGGSVSDSSVEVYVVDGSEENVAEDSGLGPSCWQEEIGVLENKLDRLSALFQEQCDLVSAIKAQVLAPKPWELPECTFTSTSQDLAIATGAEVEEVSEIEENRNLRGRSLLDAIEMKHERAASLDTAVYEALTDFLQSDELKEQLLARTASLVRDSLSSWMSHDLSSRYTTQLERYSRRMLRLVTNTLDDVFCDLNESICPSKFDNKPVRNMRRALHRHRQRLEEDISKGHGDLQNVVETVLKQELVEWRQKVLGLFEPAPRPVSPAHSSSPPEELYIPNSPPQPSDPEVSIIDQLLESAMITKSISEGDINSSFVRALSASDLSLVMSACRAADPNLVFGKPCKLEPEVMLSLMQQLATDMVHDTQLKCLYLESCITSLDSSSPCARAHLPSVASCVTRHLTRFLAAYPAHLAARRVNIILMAIGHFTK